MGPCGVASGTSFGNGLTLVHSVTHAYQQRGMMGIVGLSAVILGYYNKVALAALPAGIGDPAAICGADGGSMAHTDVNPQMVGPPAVAKIGG